MPEIRFDISKSISETAKQSGAPSYSVRNIQGLVSYSLTDLAPTVSAHFTRPGYEIKVAPLFALTMYADEANNNNLAVTDVELQVSSKVAASHEAGRAFVDELLSQFRKGKWIRHLNENCPALTGRSVYLNATGVIDGSNECALDPDYRMTSEDWIQLLKSPQYYEWVGKDTFARITASYTEDSRGLTYQIYIEFQDLAHKIKSDNRKLAEWLSEGDSKGLHSSAEYAKEKAERVRKNKLLEDAAVKRGEPLFPR